jgi:putative phage-type endonuclease
MAYRVICKAADRDLWLAERNNGIGASEIAICAGLARFSSPLKLFAQKTKALEDDPERVLPEHMEIGLALEPTLRTLLAEPSRIGKPVHEWQELLAHEEFDWARCTADGCVLDVETKIPTELKTSGSIWASEWAEGVPIYYACQVQWQIFITGAPYGYIGCLTASPVLKVLWGRVERDEALIAKLLTAGRDFWRRIQENDPPYPIGVDADDEALKALYPQARIEAVELPGALLDLDEEYQVVTERRKALEKREEELKQTFKSHIGDARKGVLPNGVIWDLNRVQMEARTVVYKAGTQFRLTRKAPK